MTDYLIKRTIKWVINDQSRSCTEHHSDTQNPEFIIMEKPYSIRLLAENEFSTLVDVGSKFDHVTDAKNHAELLKKAKRDLDMQYGYEDKEEKPKPKFTCSKNDWNENTDSRAQLDHAWISDGDYWTCKNCNFAYKKDDSRVIVGDSDITTVI